MPVTDTKIHRAFYRTPRQNINVKEEGSLYHTLSSNSGMNKNNNSFFYKDLPEKTFIKKTLLNKNLKAFGRNLFSEHVLSITRTAVDNGLYKIQNIVAVF